MTALNPHPEYGFLQLDPVPDEDELATFYESAYYDLLRRGERAPDLARMAEGGAEADAELEWLRTTIFADYVEFASHHTGQIGRVLEIGSGRGDLLQAFVDAGWQAIGLEPAVEVARACRDRGLDVRSTTLREFLADEDGFQADAVVLRFVLEHVPEPVKLLTDIESCLAHGGTLVVEVPNDFNLLQEAALSKLGGEPWWIADPDHVNYFDFASMSRALEGVGFEVVDRSTTFPMELFLLMGENYTDDPEIGAACHRRRREFEMSVGVATRRRFYRALAEADLGRSCLLTAVRP